MARGHPFLFVFFFFILGGEEAPLEEDQIEGAACDATVGEIEYRTEEYRVAVSCGDEREIKHVHHSAEHERSIIPDHSVEKTVDDVAECACSNEGKTDKHSGRSLVLPVKR